MNRLIRFFMLFLILLSPFAALATPDAPPDKIQFSLLKKDTEGNHQKVFFKLVNEKTGKPVLLSDLKTVHTRRIHLLIIDQDLDDYSHVHSRPTKEPGVYQFRWQPQNTRGNYNVWADITLKQGDQHAYLLAPLMRNSEKPAVINRKPVAESTVGGFHFALSFDPPQVHAGQAAMGKVVVTDNQGKPVTSLEPVMGAFAHLVGFDDDFKTVIHIHPMGKEPTNPSDRGGPELEFHLEAEKAGFIKLFAQVKINGRELYVPFGIKVE
ncbi:hypothetical protein [Legionella taurinensis]|uniref:Secreted protein n=1 Tax=Legionella taurinensis TaxID=70611 RepID=A0A3A5L711_9GAMM|nr:hypothetical protein [Legionella taurinensis]RJT49092.1 hypothetical protein D6J04_00060 [Legionella taurinensis]RJT67352.1 hypothetical protein D6J03_07020 [Legionella taurinensis]STY27022.1 secreted protein [Legionella taurinensis]